MRSKAANQDGGEKWLKALDQVLQWRIENLPSLPECLEAIELGFLLAKATTDAAALFAFRHAGVADERNPYVSIVDEARETLRSWRDSLKLTQPEHAGAPLLMVGPASELPPCNSADIAFVYSTILDDLPKVIDISQDFESSSVMIDYAEAHIALRDAVISRFPHCKALFEIGWLSQEFLDAKAGYASRQVFGFAPESNPFAARLADSAEAFAAWGERTAEMLRQAAGNEGAPPIEREVAACRPGEIAFMKGYLIPEFSAFVRAGLAIESIADNAALIERSFNLRDRLWSALPRCQEALEIGLLMRKIAGDWLSMQAVHNLLVKEDNRYAAQVQGDLDLFLEMREAFMSRAPGESQRPAAKPPLIEPERHTALPACTDADQARTMSILFEEINDLFVSAPNVKDAKDLLAFSRTALRIREDLMPPVNLCAENFDYVWLNIEAMNDMVALFTMLFDGIAMEDVALSSHVINVIGRTEAWEKRVSEKTRGREWREDDSADLPTCSQADLEFLVSHILPQFQIISDSAIAARSKAEFHALVDEVFVYRGKLRAGLPRCVEALELGLALLKTAGDFSSMFALDYAGVAAKDNPYLEQIDRHIDFIIARNNELVAALRADAEPPEAASALTYYVTARPHANIRACASTNCAIIGTAQDGEALPVIDDSSDWYEVRLEDGKTGFIAGFLMRAAAR